MQPAQNAAARIVHFDGPEADGCSKRSEMRLLKDANYLVRRARIYRPATAPIAPAGRPTGLKSKTEVILPSIGSRKRSLRGASHTEFAINDDLVPCERLRRSFQP